MEDSKFIITGSEQVAAANYRLTLGSQITLTLRVRLKEGATLNAITIGGDNEEFTKSGEYYMVSIPGIYANQLAKMYTIVVSSANEENTAGTCEIKISPMSYVYEMLGRTGSSDELKNLLCALYEYAQACSGN